MAIKMKASPAKNGIVINPNQFIYWPVQGTRPHAGADSVKKSSFCIP